MTKTITSPKISIIMPTWNRAAYIMESINSVLSQTWQNWELIIIDDGSEDNTEEIVLQIKDDRIRFYKAGRIAIGGKIKNIGLEKVTGELIAFIDSDDMWATSKLEKQVAALQEYPEAGFSLTGGYNFRIPGEPVDYFYKQNDGIICDDIFIPFFKSEISITIPSLMLKKKAIEICHKFDETKPFSDVDFILKLGRHFKAVILYEPLLYRRLHNDNDSSLNWERGYGEGIRLIQTYKDILPHKITKNALFRLYINFGEKCLLYKKRKMAISNFLKAWVNKPFSIIPFKKTGKAVLRYIKNN